MPERGFSLVDVMVAVALAGVLAGMSLPRLAGARRVAATRAAADWLAGRLHLARLEALKRHANVAVRWEPDGDSWRVAGYVDGNEDGVRATEIATGVDLVWTTAERIDSKFPGVRFLLAEGVPPLDGGSEEGGTEPIRVGRSRMVSFSPTGTATSGTVYLGDPRGPQLAVRVLGATGRVRTFEFDAGGRQWRGR